MDELIDRFLKYIYRKNTQSDKTIESYKNDLNQYKEYLLFFNNLIYLNKASKIPSL